MPVDLPEVAIFASGRYASAWDRSGKPIDWAEYTDADLQAMAENDAHLRRTGQPAPYIKPSHDAEPVPGQLGPLRYAAGKLYAAVEKCAEWLADQVRQGVRPWRSAEILRHAEAANYQGVSGPIFKGLALLNTHPRVKTLDSSVYAETRFAELGIVPGSQYVTGFAEAVTADAPESEEDGYMPSAEQILSALDAVGGDQKLLAKVLEALGLSTAAEGEPEAPTAVAAEPAAVAPMSDAAAAKLARMEADNALLRARIEGQEKQRANDIAHARSQQLSAFADGVQRTHGKAVADRAKASAALRMNLLPTTENFSDGKDLVLEVFEEISGLLGPATIKRTEGAATQRGGRTTGLEEFGEPQAKEEIFGEIENAKELAYLKSSAGSALLKTLVDARIAERKAEVA